MDQGSLFFESYEEAMRDDVRALGGAKSVGALMFPDKHVEAARNLLNDCLNADRRERLSASQERLLIRKVREARGFSATLQFICMDTGFEVPKALQPTDEMAALQRQFIESTRHLARMASRIEQLNAITVK